MIQISHKLKLAKLTTSGVKDWRKNPGDANAAAAAAFHYAKKAGEMYLIIPGNSYGRRVYHIDDCNADLRRYAAGIGDKYVVGGMVMPNGDVFRCRLSIGNKK